MATASTGINLRLEASDIDETGMSDIRDHDCIFCPEIGHLSRNIGGLCTTS